MSAPTQNARRRLSLAICEYDHVRDLTHGGPVRAEGIDLEVVTLPIAEIFQRFTRDREWDVSEMSLGMYVSLLSQGDTSLVALPVFTSRMFRLSSFYVRADSPIRGLADLRGRRIGYPDWMHTAGIFARGYLQHELGIGLHENIWVQAGVNAPGLRELLEPKLPPEVKRESRPDRSLDEMLVAGELDAVLSSHALKSSTGPGARTKRLVADFVAEEARYWRETGIFPIMHVVAMRRDVYERDPWIARSLLDAFVEAKNRSLERMRDGTISRFPHPWAFAWAEEAERVCGRDFWPYGLAPNRRTLEVFLQYCLDQGVAHRPVEIDELFVLEG